jgi:hypothetical protein
VGKAKRAHGTFQLFAKFAVKLANVTAPIRRQGSVTDISMKAAEWPVLNPRYKTVLHRVEMDVVHMALKIGIIPDGMLPIATLP